MATTVLERFAAALSDSAGAYDPNIAEAPVAVLWPDRDRQWEPLLPALRERLPVLTLGEFDPDLRSGPAYWLRCVVGGTIPVEFESGDVPVLYLPGVAREDLRTAESCPDDLAPLAGLQFRAQWFSHPNGRDWTVTGFLANKDRGLGAEVVPDPETTKAAADALFLLGEIPVSRLEGAYVDAKFFHDLLSPDVRRSLLDWLDDPAAYRARTDDKAWEAFRKQCRDDYSFDPDQEGEIAGARLLGRGDGAWAQVWERFREAPRAYVGIPERLRAAKPQEMFADDPLVWPQDNEEAEDRLRQSLVALASEAPGAARQRLPDLEQEHRSRRGSVWAELDQAPLAFAIEHLDRLAEHATPVPGGTVDELSVAYAGGGWRADDAVVRALAAARASVDRDAVVAAIEVVYWPWVQESATALQKAIGPLVNSSTYPAAGPPEVSPGVAVVFVDGLRLDVAHRLVEQLEGAGSSAAVDTVTAALPTVTETAKPTLVPIADGLLGPGPDLAAAKAGGTVKAGASVLRSLLTAGDVQVLGDDDTGDPGGTAWTEAGRVDHRGHDLGVGVVDVLDDEVDAIARRVRALLDAGWREVVVVTDHGWLLMPSGLPKAELPVAATECKKGRAARVKAGAVVDVPTVPWYWDPEVRIAVAPGAYCFEAGKAYEHGGVSLQECLVPRLTVTAVDRSSTRGPEVVAVKWLGLRCRVEVRGVGPKVEVDLRTAAADPSTSLVADAKATTGEATISLIVPDEEREGQTAYVVVLGDDGELLAQREVTVGVNT